MCVYESWMGGAGLDRCICWHRQEHAGLVTAVVGFIGFVIPLVCLWARLMAGCIRLALSICWLLKEKGLGKELTKQLLSPVCA